MTDDNVKPPILSELLTSEQQDTLASKLVEVMDGGFGEITITIQKGHVRFIRSLVSKEFPANDFTSNNTRRNSGEA